ncbi:MAG: hypothetical protein AAGH15_09510 [Myxococcota bacterium]
MDTTNPGLESGEHLALQKKLLHDLEGRLSKLLAVTEKQRQLVAELTGEVYAAGALLESADD